MNNTHTRIKICGLTRSDDLAAAIAAGADSIGLVFCAKSPRNLELDVAAALAQATPAFVSVVALFLNPSVQLVEAVLQAVQPEILQFHGNEDAAFCTQFKRRYMRAIAMGGADADPDAQMRAHPQACAFVLDSHVSGAVGGTGTAFNWAQAPQATGRIVLAGGLHPDNVGSAIQQAQPWAVDVSSGVEDAPGIKSAVKMAAFIQAVRTADRARHSTESQ